MEGEHVSMKLGQRLLVEHPALLVSALYVTASAIGMFFSWDYLRLFGINVFLFAEISDFLLASLKEPFTWLLTFVAVVLVLLDNAMSRRVGRRATSRWIAWYGTPGYRAVNYVVAIMIVLLFLHGFAIIKSRDTREGEGDMVTVTLADGSAGRQMLLLGTTGRFVFFFDHRDNRVDIHPNENILTITRPAGEPQ